MNAFWVFDEVGTAGFCQIRRDSVTHELRFYSPEEFWDAQAAIVTLARKQLVKLPDVIRVEIRNRYIERARETLRRGGLLVYPYGAYFVIATKPDGTNRSGMTRPHGNRA